MIGLPETRLEIDDGPWDAFVASHPSGHFLQGSAWARVRSAHGWTVERTVVVGRDGALVAGAQVLLRRRLGGWIAYAPRGPVASAADPVWPVLLAALRDRYRRRVVVLRLEPHWTDAPGARSVLGESGLVEAAPIQPPSTLLLDLTLGPTALLAAMKPKWRYNIGLAERQGVVVEAGSADDFDTFEDLLHATARRHGIGERARGYHAEVAAAFGPAARLWVARASGRTLAAALIVHHGTTATYLYGASGDDDRQRMPGHAVQWAAITDACAAGMARYDFWGVPDGIGRSWAAGGDPDVVPPETGGLWGVWRFKRGFGGMVWRAVGTWDDVYAPLRYRAAGRIAAAMARGGA
ncbi:MAG: peptidoglycan bridge formation glycyltransferase FemA/FemB family protein [Ardenticatenales bacterium]|nr:peptidoglycan bridge formation glycyltransferase FemA/FemB family protein [Ardenticatenales bacterium]